MSVHVTSLVWKCQTIDVTRKIVLLALADYSNDEGTSYPGKAALAAKTSLAPRAVDSAVIALAKDGYIDVLLNSGKASHGGKTNLYRIHLSKLEQPPASHAPASDTPRITCTRSTGTKPPASHAPKPSLEPSLSAETDLFRQPIRKIPKPETVEIFIAKAAAIGIPDQDLRDQYALWSIADWHDGLGNPIYDWKRALLSLKQKCLLPSQTRRPQEKPRNKDDVRL